MPNVQRVEDELRADFVVLARVTAAAVLGGTLGWERLTAGKWAGVRTLALVAAASALFVGVAGMAVESAAFVTTSVETDPIRIVQAVAIGIGFLGAGVVYVEREGPRVRGLTTAATVWATAALGMAVGLGRYALSIGTTALVLVILRWVARLEPGVE